MILRILEEGQLEVPDGALDELNDLDNTLVTAVESGDEEEFHSTLEALLARVRELGTPVPDDEIVPSELFLPAADSTIDEVRHLMEDEEGFLPG
ncbi:MAG: PspA-associated protein PspAA [Acidimicrobiia bacterium]